VLEDALLCGGGLPFLMRALALPPKRRQSSLRYLKFRCVCGPLVDSIGVILVDGSTSRLRFRLQRFSPEEGQTVAGRATSPIRWCDPSSGLLEAGANNRRFVRIAMDFRTFSEVP
jgi:hypothetical protein